MQRPFVLWQRTVALWQTVRANAARWGSKYEDMDMTELETLMDSMRDDDLRYWEGAVEDVCSGGVGQLEGISGVERLERLRLFAVPGSGVEKLDSILYATQVDRRTEQQREEAWVAAYGKVRGGARARATTGWPGWRG